MKAFLVRPAHKHAVIMSTSSGHDDGIFHPLQFARGIAGCKMISVIKCDDCCITHQTSNDTIYSSSVSIDEKCIAPAEVYVQWLTTAAESARRAT